MSEDRTMEVLLMIKGALRVGATFAQIAAALTDDGYTVPTPEEYNARTRELEALPDLEELPASKRED